MVFESKTTPIAVEDPDGGYESRWFLKVKQPRQRSQTLTAVTKAARSEIGEAAILQP